MNEEEIKEMLIALKNNWTIDFAKMEELCDYCLTTINELQAYKDKEDKIRELIEAPIDNMSLNWQSKLILAILNEGDK